MCDYLDGELPPAERHIIAAHRRSCLPCASVLSSLKRTVAALRASKTTAKLPAAARRRLRARLAAL
jgi:anti-sigma factor RsiW